MILYIFILIAAFPIGYLLAYLAKDELVAGRKWFIVIAIISLLCAVLVSLIKFDFKFPSILSLFFLGIICLVAAWKSY